MASRGRTPFVPTAKTTDTAVCAHSQSQFTALDASTPLSSKPPTGPGPSAIADTAASGLLELAGAAPQPASAPVGGGGTPFLGASSSASGSSLRPPNPTPPESPHSHVNSQSHLSSHNQGHHCPQSLPNGRIPGPHGPTHTGMVAAPGLVSPLPATVLGSAPSSSVDMAPGSAPGSAPASTNPPAIEPIPASLPAALYGGLDAAEDEHVTVWHPATGKTVAGNAAPYRRNLQTWLASHEGWEEKADELKSSKRRSAARRARSASTSFRSLCHYPVAHTLIMHASVEIERLTRQSCRHNNPNMSSPGVPLERVEGSQIEDCYVPPPSAEQSASAVDAAATDWTNEDYVRLQEALFILAQSVHIAGGQMQNVPPAAWEDVASAVGHAYSRVNVVLVARHLLQCGIHKAAHSQLKAQTERARSGTTAGPGTGQSSLRRSSPLSIPATGQGASAEDASLPGSFGAIPNPAGQATRDYNNVIASGLYGHPASMPNLEYPASMPNLDSATHFLDRSFRSPREPRITVWEPATGRTVSGNAAPCRKNLDAWLAQHPGWAAKGEEQLSSSRRARKTPPSTVPPRPNGPVNYGSGPGSAPTVGFPSPAPSALTSSATPRDSPVFNDALEGLLVLQNGGGIGGALDPTGGPAGVSRQATRSVSLEQQTQPQFTSSVSSGSSHCTRDDQMNDGEGVADEVDDDEVMNDESGDVDMGDT